MSEKDYTHQKMQENTKKLGGNVEEMKVQGELKGIKERNIEDLEQKHKRVTSTNEFNEDEKLVITGKRGKQITEGTLIAVGMMTQTNAQQTPIELSNITLTIKLTPQLRNLARI